MCSWVPDARCKSRRRSSDLWCIWSPREAAAQLLCSSVRSLLSPNTTCTSTSSQTLLLNSSITAGVLNLGLVFRLYGNSCAWLQASIKSPFAKVEQAMASTRLRPRRSSVTAVDETVLEISCCFFAARISSSCADFADPFCPCHAAHPGLTFLPVRYCAFATARPAFVSTGCSSTGVDFCQLLEVRIRSQF